MGRYEEPFRSRISIHALLAESDAGLKLVKADTSISIHALLAESDNRFGRPIDVQLVFLSTLSLRRATWKKFPPMCFIRHFYPRSPCGERQREAKANENRYKFLSTLSLRRATPLWPSY